MNLELISAVRRCCHRIQLLHSITKISDEIIVTKRMQPEIVPIILLGIRTAVKEDLQSSCAEIVYGTNLRLPSGMIDVSGILFCVNNFITNLCNRMQQLNPLWQHLLTARINSTFIFHYNHHLISF
ncbi:retrovirus-related Pol polyprotein from transposon 412 [Trichonephila clavipes]|uniref:Retrovirus-related Pol polyprotein from transposon 412 n=1 Tax=Trichonephila clavipes TaxID=2585209 RepID=A0A8X6S5T4_TRICX|nr:retrovirus-related Pol polyprotein from transposon 412 [Trichonephila clavipes]